MIKRIAFTAYPVGDMKKAREFYEGLLGLKCTEQLSDNWVEYDVGGTCFAITDYEMPGFKKGTQGSIAFEVSDLDELVKKLEKLGHKQSSEFMDAPTCRGAFFKDPGGNQVGLHQLK
jgi:predicted enzyme related to lactoylglutathione lyase